MTNIINDEIKITSTSYFHNHEQNVPKRRRRMMENNNDKYSLKIKQLSAISVHPSDIIGLSSEVL